MVLREDIGVWPVCDVHFFAGLQDSRRGVRTGKKPMKASSLHSVSAEKRRLDRGPLVRKWLPRETDKFGNSRHESCGVCAGSGFLDGGIS